MSFDLFLLADFFDKEHYLLYLRGEESRFRLNSGFDASRPTKLATG